MVTAFGGRQAYLPVNPGGQSSHELSPTFDLI